MNKCNAHITQYLEWLMVHRQSVNRIKRELYFPSKIIQKMKQED